MSDEFLAVSQRIIDTVDARLADVEGKRYLGAAGEAHADALRRALDDCRRDVPEVVHKDLDDRADHVERKVKQWTDLQLQPLRAKIDEPRDDAADQHSVKKLQRDVDAVANLTQQALNVIETTQTDLQAKMDALQDAALQTDATIGRGADDTDAGPAAGGAGAW